MSKATTIQVLKELLVAAESELKKAQEVAATVPKLIEEVQAIKLLLAKHTGEASLIPHPTPSTLYSPPGLVVSINSLVQRALTEAGKPQKTEQLLAFLASHGKQTTSATLRSTIWMSMKKGKLFKMVAPGVYGLLEWE